jgi:hypothetical protein
MKSTRLLLLIIGMGLFLFQCKETPIDGPQKNQDTSINAPSYSSNFDSEEFQNVIPYDFKVDWKKGEKGYSKELGSHYYEYPIIWTDEFNPDNLSERHPNKLTYKIVAKPNEGSPATFYLMKFLEEADSKTPNLQWSSLSEFSGRVYLFNKNDEREVALKYENGSLKGNLSIISKEDILAMTDGKQRMAINCVTVTTRHCTAWYDGDTGEYLSTTCSGTTTETTCYSTGGGGGTGGGTGGIGTGGGGGGGTGGGGTGGGTDNCGDPVHGCFDRTEVEDKTANVITTNPLIKYPDDSNYEEEYPKLTEYLKNKLPKVADNNSIVNAIEQFTDLTESEIKEKLQWGTGPTIVIKELENACNDCSEGTIGLFEPSNPETINLDIGMATTLEAQNPGTLNADAFTFFVGSTILHEFVHYGDWTDRNFREGEEGDLFEVSAYGQDVTNYNAASILLNNTDYEN